MTEAPVALDVLEVAARLVGRPGRVVLLSGRRADGLGRLSVAASDPDAVITGVDGAIEVVEASGETSARGADPFAVIEARLAESPESVAIGYLGYDIGATIVGAKPWPADRGREPAIWFGIYSAHFVFDHESGAGQITGAKKDARLRLADRIASPPAERLPAPELGPLEASPAVDAAYRAGFDAVREYLLAGDCYQVNLSRQLTARVEAPGDPLALLARLSARSPEPYAALIETGDHAIISASPERFLYREARGARLETRPIKGTRARTGDRARDAAARAELAASAKENAEHLMIVDLERNDLGQLARPGTVSVDELMTIADLPTLFHMISIISCELRHGVGLAEILAATFPGGSITGAPKRRSIEIIRELEPTARGVYTGAIGMLGPRGAMDLAIAIRTAVLCETSLSLHVGGGLVADSELARELAETEEKAVSWRRALGQADDDERSHHATVS